MAPLRTESQAGVVGCWPACNHFHRYNRKMAELWRRVVALSDSQLTADFQNICGIRSVREYEQNGIDKPENTTHTSKENGFPEECHESHILSGDAQQVQNGSVPFQNGTTNLSSSSLKKRYGHTNGFINHSVVQNGGRPASHQQNGTACQCQHDPHRPRANGFVHANGNVPKSDIDDPTKTLKQKRSYVIENKLLYYIFAFGASLGNEVFYIVFFSFGLWTFDAYIFRKVSIVWCVIMYVGQAAKDLICWPRPTSPPALRLEERYELEYGMPSTHAMVGVVIPFGMLYYTYGYYEVCIMLITAKKAYLLTTVS